MSRQLDLQRFRPCKGQGNRKFSAELFFEKATTFLASFIAGAHRPHDSRPIGLMAAADTPVSWRSNRVGEGVSDRVDLLAKVLWLRERKWVGCAAALAGAWLGFWEHLAPGQALATATVLTFFPGIMIAALIGGVLAGVLAAFISAGLAVYYLIPPIDDLAVLWPGARWRWRRFLPFPRP
jgi:hypothetical protein